MSTTPRTDAALLSSDCAWNCGHTFKLLIEEKYDQGKCVSTGPDIAHGNGGVVVLADFARALETELAAAQAECERLKFATEGHLLKTIQQQAELAHLRAEVERWQAEAAEMSAQRSHNANQAGILRAEVERLKPYISKAILTVEGTMLCSPQVAVKYNEAIARAERAEADTARLDWLAVSDAWFDYPATGAFTPDTMRAAIDAAMKGTT